MVHLTRVTESNVAKVAAKLEIMEHCCFVKDRIGLAMIENAENSWNMAKKLMKNPEFCSGIEMTARTAILGLGLLQRHIDGAHYRYCYF